MFDAEPFAALEPSRYALTLTRGQAFALRTALEGFARVGFGDFGQVAQWVPARTDPRAYGEVADALAAIQPTANTLGTCGNLAPGHSKVSRTVKEVWDLCQTIRRRLALDGLASGRIADRLAADFDAFRPASGEPQAFMEGRRPLTAAEMTEMRRRQEESDAAGGPPPWERVQVMAACVDDVRSVHLLANDCGRVVGYATINPHEVASKESGEERRWDVLGSVYVRPQSRRRGWATRLVAAACRWADEADLPLYLQVRHDNPALAIYEAAGFERYADRDERSAWYVRDPRPRG